jgi:hypothetical protein
MMIRVALREVEVSVLEDQFDAELLKEFRRLAALKVGASDQTPS